MPFPAGTPVVTLVGTIPSAVEGAGYTGKIVLKPSAELVDTGRHAVYPGGGSVNIVDGAFEVDVIPNNADGIEPAGWRWLVDFQPANGKRLVFWTDIHGSDGNTIYFDSLVEAPAPDGTPSEGGSGGGGPATPTGPAGGALTGTYPNPTLSEATVALFDTAGAADDAQAAAEATAAGALAAHASDGTAVHGIADTAALETQSGAQAKATAAQSAATSAAASDAATKYVALTGNQTKTGQLTFGDFYPVGPGFEPAFDNQLAPLFWVRNNHVSSRPGIFRQRDLPALISPKLLYTSASVGGTCTLSLAQTSTPTAGFVKYAPSPVPLSGSGNTQDTYGPFTYGADEIVQSAQSVNFVVSTSIDPHTTANTAGYLNVAFGTEADVVQVRLLPQTQTDTVRVFVDGVPVQATPVTLVSILGSALNAGNSHLLTINLGSAAPRRIRIEVLNARFGGVFQSPAYEFSKVELQGPKIAVLGDSTSGGSAVNTGGGSGTWFNYMCDAFGWENRWNQSRGGTGFITTNSPYTTFPNRVALDIVGKTPDIVIVDGGWNDSTSDQTAFQTAVTNTIGAIKAGLPKAWVVGVGCYSTSGNWPPYAASPTATPVAGSVTKDSWQRTVFQAQGIPYISQITGEIRDASWTLVDTIGPWMTGSGRVGAGNTTGFGTADRFLGDGAGDAIHPTDAGHKAKGWWMATALRKLMAT